jgi:hypothetical protein
MSVEEFWIGKNLDLDGLWDDFAQGSGYVAKFTKATQVYMLRLTFEEHPKSLPLFDHELICKVIKGTFHDVKATCLTPRAYTEACPIFLYRVDRGSGIYEFLAELTPLVPYVATLGAAIAWYGGVALKEQELLEKRLNFLLSRFPTAPDAYIERYIGAWTPWGREHIVRRLIREGHLCRIEVSKKPITAEVPTERLEMIDITKIVTSESRSDDV